MNRNILIVLLFVFSGNVSSEEKAFWPYGSAGYTNKITWNKSCGNSKKYRIGQDIVACITDDPDGKPYNLKMSYARNFTKVELSKMLDSNLNAELPLREHSRFKCLRLTSGWMC